MLFFLLCALFVGYGIVFLVSNLRKAHNASDRVIVSAISAFIILGGAALAVIAIVLMQ